MLKRAGYIPIVGLELHAQIASPFKLFSGSPYKYGEPPNTLLSALDIGAPGALPRVNWDCVKLAAKTGLALGCTVHQDSRFDRKYVCMTPPCFVSAALLTFLPR